MKTPSAKLPISTSAGQFVAHYSENGLAELNFPSREALVAPTRLAEVGQRRKRSEGGSVPTTARRWHRATAAALKKILAGRSPGKLPPLDLSSGTMFQRKVWNMLRKIARGRTKSYGEIARAVGKPRAVRAVGGACGANPIPVLIPCHRVVTANGKLGGFSGGLAWKRKLLAREGINL